MRPRVRCSKFCHITGEVDMALHAITVCTHGASRLESMRIAGAFARARSKIIALTALTSMFCTSGAMAAGSAPTRDWRDEILYFVLLDRFDDGDPGNNDQGQGEFDPADPRRFSGGDLAGVRRRLDYIQGLGATAVWITPPVRNQWWSLNAQFGGYHGYWTQDFNALDPHFGTVPEYRALADAMHGRGLRLVQDIVVNHTGDWFGYDLGDGGGYDPAEPARGFVLRAQVDGSTAPAPPFHRNDARDPAQRAAGWYHWTPAIRDFGDARQERDWQLADLDDLNTEHPEVRRALRAAYGRWIREIGVDGFRVDTAFYVPPEFFEDFLYADDPQAPGVMRVAAASGRPDFHVFGEGWGMDPPGEDTVARKIETYVRAPDGTPRMPGMINFPLYGTLGDVFARGRPPAELGERIARMMQVHSDPWRMPTFVDNHDVERFLSGGDEAGLRQALLAIMTLPGIPTIYYGTEQGLRAQRPAMFAAGVESGGQDRFDTEAPLYRHIRRMADLRRGTQALSRGTPRVLWANVAAPGPVAWRMDDGEARLLVAMNTATHAALLDGLEAGLPAGTTLTPVFALDGEAPALHLDADGRADLVLPPRGGYVWRVEAQKRTPTVRDDEAAKTGTPTSSGTKTGTPTSSGARRPMTKTGTPTSSGARRPIGTGIGTGTPNVMASAGMAKTGMSTTGTPTVIGTVIGTPNISTHPPELVRDDLQLEGTAPGARRLQLVVDADLEHAREIAVDADGRWRAVVATDDMIDPALRHRLVVRDPDSGAVSAPVGFRVERDWRLVTEAIDPAGDDHGPDGDYVYPDDPVWRGQRPADLLGARVWSSGGALRLQLRMSGLSTVWKPANGFDHVAFTVFFELPGRADGATAMPLQQAQLPEGMRWHLRLRAHGWSNALFDAQDADAEREGRPRPTAARIETDAETGTVTFTLPAQALGGAPGRTSLAGARLHVTTWDYDGGYRPLAPEATGNTFGGGSADGPKVMDAMTIVLPDRGR